MCLAIPAKIIAIKKQKAAVEIGSEHKEVDVSLLDCAVGDYILVSNGLAIEKLNTHEAKESLAMYQDAVHSSG